MLGQRNLLLRLLVSTASASRKKLSPPMVRISRMANNVKLRARASIWGQKSEVWKNACPLGLITYKKS